MVMIVLVGAGLVRVFDLWPPSLMLLKAASVLYLLWLAWKIDRAAPARAGPATGQPFTFLQAAAFQWVNPKGWAMALSALSIYAGDGTLAAVATVALAFALIGLPAIALWTVTGQQIARFLHQPRHLRIFNLTMAGLLVASLYPVLMPG
jgi:threonine/homoserine/homoserine lactone efflux protein